MTVRLGTLKTLALLLPAGVLGISSALGRLSRQSCSRRS